MYIDVYFDTICPWCLIGKKRLESALVERSHISLKIRWKPFLLNPSMPTQGMDRKVYLEQKFGGPQRAKRVYDAIADTGKECGIDFNFDDIKRTPNSINSHRLLAFAGSFDLAGAMVNSLFDAFFYKGLDIGDMDVLLEIAKKLGLDPIETRSFLESQDGIEAVLQSDHEARELGVHGVPAYVARDRYVVSGAQEPKILGRFIDTAWNG
jgi:predicted DsbA family dithiol-disulfide isomerase